MLSVKNITKTYISKRGRSIAAVDGLSIDFGSSGMTFILGKSGSGKSTLLNLIGGLDTPTGGKIVINGKSSYDFRNDDWDSYRNTYVGFVFQEYNLIESYCVGTNIALALEMQAEKPDRTVIDNMLIRVGLVDGAGATLYDRKINELSGGQKQRVAIARALVKNPDIILADEPTGAVDASTGAELYDLLQSLAKDRLVIIVSHDIASAKKYGDRIIELLDGKVVSDNLNVAEGQIIDAMPAGQPSGSTLELKKSSLPLKRSFILGAGALKHKKVRLITSILLAVVTFVVFGFSISAMQSDAYGTELRTIYDNGYEMIGIFHPKRDGSAEALKAYNGGKDPMPAKYSDEDFYKYLGNSYNMDRSKYIWSPSEYIVGLDPANGESDANLRPDGRFVDKSLCKLPQVGEIAITDYIADKFLRYGYKQADDTVIDIATPDDLIGLELDGRKISGVYSTEVDLDIYREFDYYYNDYISNMLNGMPRSIFTCRFTHIDDPLFDRYDGVMIKLSGNISKDTELLLALSDKRSVTNPNPIIAQIISPYSTFMMDATAYERYVMPVALAVAVAFLVISMLLTMNYLSTSIGFKKRELGILRALGARRRDIIIVCLSESLLLAAVEFVISLIGVGILCAVLNGVFYTSMFSLGILPILTLFALSFGVTAIATILPALRLANKTPIEAMKSK